MITLPVGPAGTRCQLAPPLWVAYSALPAAHPSAWFANRSVLTPARTSSGSAIGAFGAGIPRQDAPPLTVRTMEVHGGCAHGAVPSTQPDAALMKLVEYTLNPDGTGPPDGPTGAAGEPVVR